MSFSEATFKRKRFLLVPLYLLSHLPISISSFSFSINLLLPNPHSYQYIPPQCNSHWLPSLSAKLANWLHWSEEGENETPADADQEDSVGDRWHITTINRDLSSPSIGLYWLIEPQNSYLYGTCLAPLAKARMTFPRAPNDRHWPLPPSRVWLRSDSQLPKSRRCRRLRFPDTAKLYTAC